MRSAAKRTQTPRAERRGAFAFSAACGLALALVLVPPAGAQNATPGDRSGEQPNVRPVEPGPDERMFDEFAQRMLDSILQSLTPDHRAWLDVIKNIDRYEAPEIQPNGDVLIRRKPSPPRTPEDGDPPASGEDAGPGATIDL